MPGPLRCVKRHLDLVSSETTDPRVKDPAYYATAGITWLPTSEVDVDSGFRLDVAMNIHGDLCGVRVVPVQQVQEIPHSVLEEAGDALHPDLLKEAALASMPSYPVPPDELLNRVKAVRARFGKKRPNADSVHTGDFNQLVLDVGFWGNSKHMPAADAIRKAFSVSESTSHRWLKAARKASGLTSGYLPV